MTSDVLYMEDCQHYGCKMTHMYDHNVISSLFPTYRGRLQLYIDIGFRTVIYRRARQTSFQLQVNV